MRIIAGAKRGKKLIEKCDAVTRPTTDRVRENIFNILENQINFSNKRVLDLFAGCGAYGLESYSRGASYITFNDIDDQAVEVVNSNCRLIGCKGRIMSLDFSVALKKLKGEKFDLIFLDPPYDSNFIHMSIDIIFKEKLLSENGICIVETEKDNLEFPSTFSVKYKKYGRARIYFLYLVT